MAFCLMKYQPHGGMQRDFLRIALRCQEQGYRIRVYALSWEGRIPDGMDVIIVPAHGVTNHRRYARYANWVAKALEAQPVVCSVGFHAMAGLDVYYAAEDCYAARTQPNESRTSWRNARHRYFADAERAVFGRGSRTRIMLIAENQRAAFERHYGTNPERMVLLPPGVARDRMAPDNAGEVRANMRAELGVSADQYLLLMIGSSFIDNGLDRSLIALAQLPQQVRLRTRLIAIGHDDPRSFVRMAQRLRIVDRFTVLQGRDDIPRFLQAADLLLHPASYDPGGSVLLEALVAGLPPISTDVCGHAGYVTRAEAGRVMDSPFRQDVLNGMVAEALADTTQRERWRRNGIEFGRTADLYSRPTRAAAFIAKVAGPASMRRNRLDVGADDDRHTLSA
jgi:UDP-glucose:(heptosyl)LPS alpha-1,3-glucosyltransferase